MYKFLMCLGLFLILTACQKDSKVPAQIAAIEAPIRIERFDKAFANAQPEDLQVLQAQYPYMFAKQYDDAYWENKLVDTLQNELETAVINSFPDMEDEKQAISELYQHIQYYFPETTIPTVITITSEVDYRNKVFMTDSLLFIALDTYLGSDHRFYGGIPKYHSKNFRPAQLDVDIASAFAKAHTSRPRQPHFLAQMIYEGKQLYLMDALLTAKAQHELFGYTEAEYQFAVENQKNMWEYFVSSELLYKTDRNLLTRFIDPAPFSKFYLSFDNETPGRVGRFIGYKIVASYMENNDVALKTMLNQTADVIFANAKYKP
ncbi:MAG: gliding motility lipoprotein GldB [Cytophagaceae bacterium]|nr:gliding motility lipoprotein GldB [Cytophagaceae bacterium]